MTARYYLVGDAPPQDEVETPDLWLTPDESGRRTPANRMLELTGWTLAVFLETFTPRTYLWKGRHWMWVREGRARAGKIAEASGADGSAGVVILGDRAAQMFDMHAEEPLTWCGRFAVVPHTSWQNGAYWTPERAARAREFFASLLHKPSARRKTGH